MGDDRKFVVGASVELRTSVQPEHNNWSRYLSFKNHHNQWKRWKMSFTRKSEDEVNHDKDFWIGRI